MPHEIERLMRAAGRGVYLVEPVKAEEIIAMLSLRIEAGPRGEPAFPDRAPQAMSGTVSASRGTIHVLRLHGAIVPRGNMLSDMSGAVSMERFQAAFRAAAEDRGAAAIVLDIDSPGGNVAMIPETVAMIRAARRSDRPIIAQANVTACSAAYWIACAADEIVATTSGIVGSIGVFSMHQDVSERMKEEGVKVTYLSHGPRKTEGNPFEPLDETARAAMSAFGRDIYDMFTKDVAKARGVPVATVRADPEATEEHFGGGRAFGAATALKLGMIDGIATLEETLRRAARGSGGGRRGSPQRASLEKRRLALR